MAGVKFNTQKNFYYKQNREKKCFDFLTLLGKYWLEKKGATECQTGSKVLLTSHCKSACADLNIPLGNFAFEDGKPCFRGVGRKSGDYRCKQMADLGANANLICQSSGN